MSFLGITFGLAAVVLIGAIVLISKSIFREPPQENKNIQLEFRFSNVVAHFTIPAKLASSILLTFLCLTFLVLTIVSWQAALVGGVLGAVGSQTLFKVTE